MLENLEQAMRMMIIYGIGFAAVFAVFTLLYFHAFRNGMSWS